MKKDLIVSIVLIACAFAYCAATGLNAGLGIMLLALSVSTFNVLVSCVQLDSRVKRLENEKGPDSVEEPRP